MGYNIKPVLTESFISTNDLRLKQYYGVKLSADRTVILPTADTDIPVGILMNKPNEGEMAEVMVIGRAPIAIAEALTAGQMIRVASGGLIALAEVSDTTTYVVGQVVEHAGVSGEIAEAIVNFTNLTRAN